MKSILKHIDIKLIVIISLIIAILCLRYCGEKPNPNIVRVDGKPYQVIKHTVDTMYVPTVKTVYKRGKSIYKDKPIYVQLPGKIDTVTVLSNYYSKLVFKDTLKLGDSLGYVSVIDTIFNNYLTGRIWNSRVNKIVVKDFMVVKELPKNQIYLGGMINLNNNNGFTSIGPSVQLKTKKDRVFLIGAGLGRDNSIHYQGGVYFKIW